MSKQEVFDRALFGIRAQGGPSRNADGGSCKYRTSSGRKCAIGHNISDEAYDSGLEGRIAENVLITEALRKSGVIEETLFLTELQLAHDQAPYSDPLFFQGDQHRGRGFESRMAGIARAYNLTYTPNPNYELAA